MESIIECIVCLESYNSLNKLPLILSCGHTLCKECVMKINYNSQSIKCPIDRKIEPKATKQLTINYAILQVLHLHKSGVPSRETCSIHSQAVTLICKTCSSNCCYKCVRNHSGHDIYDVDHPIILTEIETGVKRLADRIEEGFEASNRSCERIKKELRELSLSRNKLKGEINSTYDYFIKQVEIKRKESLNILEVKFKDKEEFLNSCFCEAEMHVKHYEGYQKEVDLIRKQLNEKNFVDRAVTCTSMMKKMLVIQYPSVRDINNNNLRLMLDKDSLSVLQIPVIKVSDYSPAEVLEKTYLIELEELQRNFVIHQKLACEHKLSYEVSCSSLYAMTQQESLFQAKLHLLNYCCWEILQQDYSSLNETLKQHILVKAGLPKMTSKLEYSLSSEFLSKIRYVKGLIWGLGKLADKQWEDALVTFHSIIMKENEFNLAEEILQVALLRMCSFSFSSIKSYQVIDSLPIVQLITKYVKFHFLPGSVLYRQVAFHLKYAFLYVKNSLPDFFFPFFELRYTACLNDLEVNCNQVEMLPIEYPPELQYHFSLLNEDSVKYWKNKELGQKFVESFQNFKEDCSAWYQALILIRERKDILEEAELLVLERS